MNHYTCNRKNKIKSKIQTKIIRRNNFVQHDFSKSELSGQRSKHMGGQRKWYITEGICSPRTFQREISSKEWTVLDRAHMKLNVKPSASSSSNVSFPFFHFTSHNGREKVALQINFCSYYKLL